MFSYELEKHLRTLCEYLKQRDLYRTFEAFIVALDSTVDKLR